MRLIDADSFRNCLNSDSVIGATMLSAIDEQPTIDPETLPIVRQLRKELNKVKEEMDEVADLCGKLIVLCEAFNRIFYEFEGTASNSAYQAVRKATDKEAEKRKLQKEE